MWVSAANESSNSYSVEPVDILQYPYLDDNFIIFQWCSNQMTIFDQHW